MSEFYQKKFYNRKGNDSRFYIPLTNYKVNVERLRKEVELLINPLEQTTYGLTTAKEFVDEDPHNFKRYSSISKFNEYGERILSDGKKDEDIVYWPKALNGTYIQDLGLIFSDLIKIKNPRVRLSVSSSSLSMHNDPHTPYRIHIALKSHFLMHWLFKDKNGNVHKIHQPANGVPVLIETGITKHGVYIPEKIATVYRIHLWYQFHDIISDEILSQL